MAGGQWQLTYHDLANALIERSTRELDGGAWRGAAECRSLVSEIMSRECAEQSRAIDARRPSSDSSDPGYDSDFGDSD